jgi:hypothetical protein
MSNRPYAYTRTKLIKVINNLDDLSSLRNLDGFAEIEGQRIRLMTVPHPFKQGPLVAFMYGDKLLQLRDEPSTFKNGYDAQEAANRHGFIVDKDGYVTFGVNWRP